MAGRREPVLKRPLEVAPAREAPRTDQADGIACALDLDAPVAEVYGHVSL